MTYRPHSGSRLLWARGDTALEPFEGTLVDLIFAVPRRTIPQHSRQQRADWELCMAHIAMARPARGEDATDMLQLMGAAPPLGTDPATQLDTIARHLMTLEPLVAPRVFARSLERLDRVRQRL